MFVSLQAAILYNMKKRHIDGKPYTRTGDIIIAINPFHWFTDGLYTEKKRTYYLNRIVWEASEIDPRDGMEPFVIGWNPTSTNVPRHRAKVWLLVILINRSL
jgi:hypothetical protein